MARMDTRMPLMVQQPDFVNALARSSQAAAQTNAVQDQNALRQLYQTQGADIAAGKPGAINALAGLDPMAALGVQDARQGMAARAELMEQRRVAATRQAAEYAATLDDRERAAEAARMEAGITRAIGLYQAGDLPALNEYLVGVGEEPLQSLEQFPAVAALYGGALDALKTVKGLNAPQSGPGKVFADIQSGNLPAGTPLTGSGTTVNVNTGDQAGQLPIVDKPPKGFQRRWDPERNTFVDEPIPGGDVETDRSAAGRKSDLAQAGYQRKSDIVNSNIDKAMQMLDESGRWVAGFGSMLAGVPESGARDFQAVLDTVKANLGFEELQAMRDASPTGGALGAVTEKEIAFLQAIQGNLDAAQSPAQLKSVLQEIKDRRAEFAAERGRILSKNQTAAQAADLQDRVRGMPNFQQMSDEELDAFIRENER